jgi:hypothetical protein
MKYRGARRLPGRIARLLGCCSCLARPPAPRRSASSPTTARSRSAPTAASTSPSTSPCAPRAAGSGAASTATSRPATATATATVVVDFEMLEVLRDGRPSRGSPSGSATACASTPATTTSCRCPAEYSFTLRYRTTRQLGFFDRTRRAVLERHRHRLGVPDRARRGGCGCRSRSRRPRCSAEAYTGPQGARRAATTAPSCRAGHRALALTREPSPGEGFTVVLDFPRACRRAQPGASGCAGCWPTTAACWSRWPALLRAARLLPAPLAPGRARPARRHGHRPLRAARGPFPGRPALHAPDGLRQPLLLRRPAGAGGRRPAAHPPRQAAAQGHWRLERLPAPTEAGSTRRSAECWRGCSPAARNSNWTTARPAPCRQHRRATQGADQALRAGDVQPQRRQHRGGLLIADRRHRRFLRVSSGGAGIPAIIGAGVLMLLVLAVFGAWCGRRRRKVAGCWTRSRACAVPGRGRTRGAGKRMPGPRAPPVLDAQRFERLLPYAVALEVEDAWTRSSRWRWAPRRQPPPPRRSAGTTVGGVGDIGRWQGRRQQPELAHRLGVDPAGQFSSGGGGGGSSGGGGGGGGGGGR